MPRWSSSREAYFTGLWEIYLIDGVTVARLIASREIYVCRKTDIEITQKQGCVATCTGSYDGWLVTSGRKSL